jgi:parvulin-like peptidyl-prolyl isomerase
LAFAIYFATFCARVRSQELLGVGMTPEAAPFATTPIAPTPDAASLDGCQVIARIGGQPVLACEVLWEINKLLEAQGDRIPPDQIPQLRQHFMLQKVKEMLDRKLIYAEFVRNVPPENLPKIAESLQTPFEEKEIPELMKALNVTSREALEQELVRLGSSLNDVRQTFIEREAVRFWVRSRVKFNEEIRPDEMLQYYQEHLAAYEYPTQARWEELMVRKARFPQPQQAFAELASMGNEVWQQAAATPGGVQGPAFVAVAKARSDGFNAKDGGQYDWTEKGALRTAAIDQALFTLQVGQMSPILESDIGFHIIRVLERKEAGRKTFTEVQADIREKLKEERFQVAVTEYLSKIRGDAQIWTAQTGDVSAEVLLARPPGATQQR